MGKAGVRESRDLDQVVEYRSYCAGSKKAGGEQCEGGGKWKFGTDFVRCRPCGVKR